jgi:prepilin-type N-terminal cleavage/methylation domain-containing protein
VVRRRGFTLMELMVTLTAIAVLAAIALPLSRTVILGNQQRVNSNALERVALAQQSHEARYGTFVSAEQAGLLSDALGNDLTLTSGASQGPSEISMTVTNSGQLMMAVLVGGDVCNAMWLEPALRGGQRTSSSVTLTQGQPCSPAAVSPEQ